MTTIKFDVYALTLNSETTPRIIEAAATLGWTLDHLQDNVEFNAEDGFETTLLMKLFPDDNEIATFNEVTGDYAENMFRVTEDLDPHFGILYKADRI